MNEYVYEASEFISCDLPTYREVFECCEELAAGDKYLDYDCKVSLPGEDNCDSPELCELNYKKAKELVDAERE